MMMIIFSFLLLAGCIQLGLWYRQQNAANSVIEHHLARWMVQ